jgi:hypothetical protein
MHYGVREERRGEMSVNDEEIDYIIGLNNKIRAKDTEIARLDAERRRDALDGQSTMEEAYATIALLKEENYNLTSDIENWKAEFERQGGRNWKLQEENAALRERVGGIRNAIDGGEEDGLAAWVIIREIKHILGGKS